MDQIDRQLVQALAENARTSLQQLSQKVFLSSPAVAARVERLEDEGVITGYHAAVNPALLGYQITAFIRLAVPPERRKEFAAFLKESPQVLECYHISGDYSMLMKSCFVGTTELDHFVERAQKIGKTETQLVFSSVMQPREFPSDIAVEQKK